MIQKIRKMMVVALSVVMLTLTMAVSASAAEIQPRLPACPNCGRGLLVPSKSYGAWYVADQPRCTHLPYGTDQIQKRNVTTTNKCNVCGAGSSTNSTETRTVCKGYN